MTNDETDIRFSTSNERIMLLKMDFKYQNYKYIIIEFQSLRKWHQSCLRDVKLKRTL